MGFANLTVENLDRVAKKEKKAYLIKFTSASCGPCKTMVPILEAFHQDNPQVSMYEVDVDKSYDLSGHFGIRSVPTTLVCEGRNILYQFSGVTPKGDLEFVFENIDDEYFREHGEFKKSESKDLFLWIGVGSAISFLLGLFFYVIKFY